MHLANALLKASQSQHLSDATKNALEIGSNCPDTDSNFIVNRAREVMRDYDLYSFTKSATYAASDLRLGILNDTFFDVARVIFNEPRKIFLECSFQERKLAFSHVHEFERDELVGVSDPSNIAFIVDSYGDGTGALSVCWMHKRNASPLHQMIATNDKFRDDKSRILNIGRISFSVYEAVVNLNATPPLSKQEFLEERNVNGSLAQYVWTEVTANQHKHNKEYDLEDWAYLSYKLNCFSAIQLPKDNMSHHQKLMRVHGFPDSSLQGDMDGELTFAIPFLGLLVSDALEKTPREQKVVRRSTGRLKSKKQKSQDLEYQAGVNVCSLDLSPDLLRAQVTRDDVQSNAS